VIPTTKVLPVDGGNVGGGGDCLGVRGSVMGNGMVGGLEWVWVMETLRPGTGWRKNGADYAWKNG